MGAWSTGIHGNDTAQDLQGEYTAAFWKYDVPEALEKLEEYVRRELDPADEETWADYCYSLADFMWKKGILTPEVRDRAVGMIDRGFALAVWEEAGEKTLRSRKKVLAALREKLLSPQPPKKKIRPKIHASRIFTDGDILAVQLRTAGKPYTMGRLRAVTEEEFHACDGKYVLMQLVSCKPEWRSALAPEVGDHWATFRLFDGVYDRVPETVDLRTLRDAEFLINESFTPYFTCESSMVYFRRRGYLLLGNDPAALADRPGEKNTFPLSFGVDRPWYNPDSELLAAMGKEPVCGEYRGFGQSYRDFILSAVAFGRRDYARTGEEDRERFYREMEVIADRAMAARERGGKILQLTYGGVLAGFVTVDGKRAEDLYIRWDLRRRGFGAKLLAYALAAAGEGAYADVPAGNAALTHLCEKLGLTAVPGAGEGAVRFQRE